MNAPAFDLSEKEIGEVFGKMKGEVEKALEGIISVPEKERNFENTLGVFENAMSGADDAVTIPIFLAYVSENESVRRAAQELELRVSRYFIDIFSREDVYNALKEYADREDAPGEVEKRLLEKTLLAFERNGLGLARGEREKVKTLKKELVETEIEFSTNLRNVKDVLEVSEEDLKGLPPDYVSSLKKNENGGYIVTMDYPDYIPFMFNSESDEARRKLEFKFNNRCYPRNLELMEKAIKIRKEIASLLGYPNFADYVLSDRMAGESGRVFEFLERTASKLRRKAVAELEERMELKRKRKGESGEMKAWESGFYNNLLKKEKYSIDHEKIKEYFPLESVMPAMLKVFGDLFGASFEKSGIPVWHKDVEGFEVKNRDGETEAYFYLDLFPREGKYKHAACFGIRQGREMNGIYRKPAAAIVANFPKPSSEYPSLLKFSDVVTLFHEFGHVTHNIFTRAKYGSFSGTSVSRDFVEVPSKMLEYWAYSPEVLEKISSHYRTGEKLPREIINRLIAARNMDSGLSYLRQIFFSLLDMKYHTAEGEVDTTGLYAGMKKEISLIPMSEGTHPQASFGHLMGGYEAGYYGYLWAEVIAADLFSEFERKGIMDAETGGKYRELILAPGRSYDENAQVEKFLGRPYNEDAFLKSIGAEAEKENV